ncbi:MAG: helix-turn-helix transcriptional regulator, partial [Acidobacteria bacterium]|nr:helix-turn-helix transcriptional regulator [Acidobacteriota bacterium]
MNPDAHQEIALHLSLTEWVVLALIDEAPSHGFAIAKELRTNTDLGRILTVHRPLVYRALDRLAACGDAEPHQIEPGDAGPNRTLHRVTPRGHAAV